MNIHWPGRKAMQYLFFEMWPSFILGLFLFIFILLMFQVLRLTEFVLVHGISLQMVGQMMLFMSVSFLPALFPMSLLFSVLLTYGRMSQDSEILALKSVGYSSGYLLFPAAVFSVIVGTLSFYTAAQLAPWGNRQFELMITALGQSKAAANLKGGTFSEGFFDLVVYANEVNSRTGELSKVFIYDENSSDVPLTIIAKSGRLIHDIKKPGHAVMLELKDGDIHRKSEAHTKIKFDTFDVKLLDPVKMEIKEKTPPSLAVHELFDELAKTDLNPEKKLVLQTEVHKRFAIAFACCIFGLLGVGLGIQTNRRSQKSGGMILCIVIIIGYWILYITGEGMSRSGQLMPAIAMWLPNALFGAFSLWGLKSSWN